MHIDGGERSGGVAGMKKVLRHLLDMLELLNSVQAVDTGIYEFHRPSKLYVEASVQEGKTPIIGSFGDDAETPEQVEALKKRSLTIENCRHRPERKSNGRVVCRRCGCQFVAVVPGWNAQLGKEAQT